MKTYDFAKSVTEIFKVSFSLVFVWGWVEEGVNFGEEVNLDEFIDEFVGLKDDGQALEDEGAEVPDLFVVVEE